MLKIENLTKSYDKKTKALDSLTLSVNEGEIFGFIGHNGAGKTTAIKSITGVLPFDSGTVELDGISLTKSPIAYKQKIAYIPDNPDLYENLTGIKYINFICDIYGLDGEKRRSNIERFAEAFEITADLGSPISSYSHGMKQKVALIAALAHEPKLLILDEPFVGLDPKAAHSLKLFMRELCDNGGIIFFSTHVLEVAEKLCDRIAIIKKGVVVKEGFTSAVVGDSSLENIFLELVE